MGERQPRISDRSFVVASFTRISTICVEYSERTNRGRSIMNFGYKFAMTLVGAAIGASMCSADTLPTHRIPAALAIEAASETIAACARQGYRETAVVLDADGATIVAVRGDGASSSIARTTRRTPASLSKTTPSLWLSVRRARIRLHH